MMVDDMTLVREYAASQSEAAFAALVQRHVALVHSAALRQTGDAHLAEEVTQTVFIVLARKSASLGPETILPAWLYRAAHYAAADALKGQRRRRLREQEAYMQSNLHPDDTANAWQQLAPLLDDAMAELAESDRAPLVLRYFHNRPWREVAALIRVTEDAAQKRVKRALEKLRALFVKRGVTLSAALIAGAVSAHSVQAAPLGLAARISTAAMAGATVSTTTTVTLFKTIAMTSLQKTALAGGLICAVALTALWVNRPHPNSPKPQADPHSIVERTPPSLPVESPATIGRRVDSLHVASPVVEPANDGMWDMLARLQAALYAPKSSGQRRDDPAYRLLYSIPREKRAAALEMVMKALRDPNEHICRRAISLIPLIWPQGEAALPTLYDLVRTKSQEWPGLASQALMSAVQVRSEPDVIPGLVLAAMQGGRASQQEFVLQLPIIKSQIKDSSAAFAANLQPYLNSLDANTRLATAQLLAQLPGTTDKSVVAELATSLSPNSDGQNHDDRIRTSLGALMKMGVKAQDALPALVELGIARPDLEDSVMLVLKAIAPEELKGVGVATPLPPHDENSQTVGQLLANGTMTMEGAIDALKDPLLMLPTARALADYGPSAAVALPALREALATNYTKDPNSAAVLASVIERLDPEQPKPLLIAWDVMPALRGVAAEAAQDKIAGVENALTGLREKLPIGLMFSHGDIRDIYARLHQLDPRLAGVFQSKLVEADARFAAIFQAGGSD